MSGVLRVRSLTFTWPPRTVDVQIISRTNAQTPVDGVTLMLTAQIRTAVSSTKDRVVDSSREVRETQLALVVLDNVPDQPAVNIDIPTQGRVARFEVQQQPVLEAGIRDREMNSQPPSFEHRPGQLELVHVDDAPDLVTGNELGLTGSIPNQGFGIDTFLVHNHSHGWVASLHLQATEIAGLSRPTTADNENL